MVKAELCWFPLPCPIGARSFQQMVGAGDVGLDEIAGTVDGTVHMAFGRQMHHRIRSMLGKDPVEGGAVADVGLLEGIVGALCHACHIVETGGIGERIEIHHAIALGDGAAYHGGADETRSSGDQKFHGVILHGQRGSENLQGRAPPHPSRTKQALNRPNPSQFRSAGSQSAPPRHTRVRSNRSICR